MICFQKRMAADSGENIQAMMTMAKPPLKTYVGEPDTAPETVLAMSKHFSVSTFKKLALNWPAQIENDSMRQNAVTPCAYTAVCANRTTKRWARRMIDKRVARDSRLQERARKPRGVSAP